MVVALGAYHLRAQKELRGVGHVVQFHAGIPQVVTGGPVFPRIALCSNQRVGYLVERFVRRYLFLDPMVIKFTGSDLAPPRILDCNLSKSAHQLNIWLS